MSRTLGRAFSAASLRSRGTARIRPTARATSTTTAKMIQTSLEFPPDSGVTSKWMVPQANGSETRSSTAIAIQLDVAMMAPELSATGGVVALSLVEADPGGEDRRRAAGQRAE